MIEIQPGLIYLTRADWGARTDIPRLGHSVNRLDRTEAIMHHTVITPNFYDTVVEVKVKMVRLQTIRPDLGLDVPYNFVAFHMTDGSLVICEGRGFDRTGAHTHAHNTAGMATAGQGNFNLSPSLSPYADHWSRWWGYQKFDMGMENLGSSYPARGIAFGHTDLAATSCPGDNLYMIIPQLQFKEDDMTDEEFLAKLNKLLTQARIPATLEDGKTPQSGVAALGSWLDASRLHEMDAAKHSAGEAHDHAIPAGRTEEA